MYEEAFFHLIEPLQRRAGLADVALADGCAMDSVANGKIRRATLFRRVYVQSTARDAGGDHTYWGPGFPRDEVATLLAAQRPRISASAGAVEGRMEWGPRALGNRSIVCDPRRADMKSLAIR